MRRIIVSTAAALGLVAFTPGFTHAQESPGLCTDPVYTDPGVTPRAEPNQLRMAMDRLESHGADPRAYFLEDFRGYETSEDFAYEVLANKCPDFFYEEDGYLYLQDDLVLFFDAYDPSIEFPLGELIGSDFEGYADYDNFGGSFAINYGLMSEAIEAEQNPASNPGAPTAPNPTPQAAASSDGGSIPWGLVITVLAVLALAPLIIALLILRKMKKDVEDERARLQALLKPAKDNAVNLMLSGNDFDVLNLQDAIDDIPDDEDDDLEALLANYKRAADEGLAMVAEAEAALQNAKNGNDLFAAENIVAGAVEAIANGITAKEAIAPALENIRRIREGMQGRIDHISVGRNTVAALITTRQEEGFIVDAFSHQLREVDIDLGTCKKLQTDGSVYKADKLLIELEEEVADFKEELDELPDVPKELANDADELQTVLDGLTTQHEAAVTALASMASEFHHDDVADLSGFLAQAKTAIDQAGSQIGFARTAASMNEQDFDGAEMHLETAGTLLDSAKTLIGRIGERNTELTQLRSGLASTMAELVAHAEQVRLYIHSVSGDISPTIQTEFVHLRARVNGLSASWQSYGLRKADEEQRTLSTSLTGCKDSARTQHDAKEAIRKKRDRKRTDAKDKLTEAAPYQEYASKLYERADNYFDDNVDQLPLEEQLAHWERALTAASQAYAEGKAAYDRAHRPVYVPSYQRNRYDNSPSFDFGTTRSRPTRSSSPSRPSSPSRSRSTSSSPGRRSGGSSSSRSRSSSSSSPKRGTSGSSRARKR